jgi:hypothetical protein
MNDKNQMSLHILSEFLYYTVKEDHIVKGILNNNMPLDLSSLSNMMNKK